MSDVEKRLSVQLVRRSRAGDANATRALVELLRQPLVNIVERASGSRVVSAELAETPAEALAAAIATFDDQGGLPFRDYATTFLERMIGHHDALRPLN